MSRGDEISTTTIVAMKQIVAIIKPRDQFDSVLAVSDGLGRLLFCDSFGCPSLVLGRLVPSDSLLVL